MRNSKEWFSANELVGKKGLPLSPQGINKKARTQGWKKRNREGIQGGAVEYHYSSFPPDVQQQLGFDVVDKENHFIQKGDDFSYIETLSVKEEHLENKKFAFRTDWLRKFAIDIAQSSFMRMPDDNMERTIYQGDKVLVTVFHYKEGKQLKRGIDTLERLWQLKDGLYAVQINSRLTIRRLQFDFNKGLHIICDNPLYQPIHLTQEQIDPNIIVGQVRWYAHTVKWD